MRIALALTLSCGCGRIAFDQVPDASPDAAAFQEAVGELDPTFGTNGLTLISGGVMDASLWDIVARDAGGYLAIGAHQTATERQFGLAAFTPAGQLDPAIGNAGILYIGPTMSDFGYGMQRLADGRVLVLGDGDASLGAADDMTVGMIDQAGNVDPTFGPGGFRRFDVVGATDPDTSRRAAQLGSSVVICGAANYAAGDSHFALVRVGLDGTPTVGFGAGGTVTADFSGAATDTCNDVVALPNGNLAATGGTGMRAFVASYRPDGVLDPSFAGGSPALLGTGFAVGMGVAVAPDGDLVLAGESNRQGFVAKLAPDGTPRAAFGQAGVVEVSAAGIFFDVVVQPDGKIVAAGTSPSMSGAVVRLAADGTLDPTFAGDGVFELQIGVSVELTSVILTPDGGIVVVGPVGMQPSRGLLARLR